jgi:hypothetical protein
MCSRIGASLANATGFGQQMIVSSIVEYEQRAVGYALGLSYTSPERPSDTPTQGHLGHGLGTLGASYQPRFLREFQLTYPHATGELATLRRNLYVHRHRMPLFDTLRWTRNLEKGLEEAWRRWVTGTEFPLTPEWMACDPDAPERQSTAIWVMDNDPFMGADVADLQ